MTRNLHARTEIIEITKEAENEELMREVEDFLASADVEPSRIDNQPLEKPDPEFHLDVFSALERFIRDKKRYDSFSTIFISGYLDSVEDEEETEEFLNEIFQADSQDRILDILSKDGFEKEVSGFQKALADVEVDDEFGEVSLESLKAAARFLKTYDVPYSPMEFDDNGDILLEWMLSADIKENHEDDMFWGEGDSHFILRFISANLIEFALSSGAWDGNRERMILSGRLSHNKMCSILDMFRERIISFD